MIRLSIILNFIILVLSSDWYSREDYIKLKRTVKWTPFTPEEHPLKNFSKEAIHTLLSVHKNELNINENLKIEYTNQEENKYLHIPSFLFEVPTQYKVDDNFIDCVQKPFIYSKSCPRSDISSLTRTLAWSDCARNLRKITFSSKNLLLCDVKNFGNSCFKSKDYLSLFDYYDNVKPTVGFIPDSCNPSDLNDWTGKCLSSGQCADGTVYETVKINEVKIISRVEDFYNNLQKTYELLYFQSRMALAISICFFK